jgi:hypothetical protein
VEPDRWAVTIGCLLILIFAVLVGFTVHTKDPAQTPRDRDVVVTTTTVSLQPSPSSVPVPGEIECVDSQGHVVHTDIRYYDRSSCIIYGKEYRAARI